MTSTNLQATWEEILKKLETTSTKIAYDTWFKPIVPLQISDTTIELGVQKNFMKEWIDSHYIDTLTSVCNEVINKNLKITILSFDQEDQQSGHTTPNDTESNIPTATSIKSALTIDEPTVRPTIIQTSLLENPYADNTAISQTAPVKSNNFKAEIRANALNSEDSFNLNPKYTFETFVTGNSNRFAHAAAIAVADAPAKAYNPFFMYGGVGLGKTHLMHAIGHSILKNNPQLRVLYISSEKFTNELINSILNGNPENFRQKYRNIDVLLVDDIQFLSKKEHTQEEFFHTFNTLHEANKQIIISSDRPPRDIQTLEDRLRSRFEWGLITDIQAPDLETRIAILRKKAMMENLNVPNDVMVYIASRIDNNIRELEGALTRVVAYASLSNQSVTNELAVEALKDIFMINKNKQITMELIQEIVSSYFKIKIDELIAKKRTRNLAFPRQIAMYLCRELTNISLPKIGDMFGGRDHTTVLHAYDKINRERNDDVKLNNTIKELIKRIENS